MKLKIPFVLRLYLFWLGVFFVFRFLFFVLNTTMSVSSMQGFYQGVRTDISMASYLMIPSFLLWWIFNITTRKSTVLLQVSKGINVVLFFLISIVEVASIPLYKDWGTTFNSRAYYAVLNSADTRNTAMSGMSILVIVGLLLMISLGAFLVHRLHANFIDKFGSKLVKWITLLPSCLLLFVAIRGGLFKKPIKTNSAFYTNIPEDNYLAVNKTFYFLNSLKMRDRLDIDDILFDNKQLDKYKMSIREKRLGFPTILGITNPNIVMIIMEGCPADVLESLDGVKGLMPNLTRLCKDGLLFSDIYSSGFRTDQGLLSVLSGVPSVPYLNVMKDYELVKHMPSIYSSLNKHGYYTSFLYGGNLDFSNLRNYFIKHQVDKTIGKSSYPLDKRTINWGVPDNYLFDRAIKEIGEFKEPFFTTMLTQATHPPFDMNGPYKYGETDITSKYKSTVYALDQSLGKFIDSCRNEPWYEQTLFLVLADHGSLYLGNRNFNDHERFRIPLLMFGPALKDSYKDRVNSTIGNHHDIAETLLSQLSIESDDFLFSKNLLDTTVSQTAYWITEQTLGWVTPEQKLVINHHNGNNMMVSNPKVDSIESSNNAMMYYKLVADYVLKQKE